MVIIWVMVVLLVLGGLVNIKWCVCWVIVSLCCLWISFMVIEFFSCDIWCLILLRLMNLVSWSLVLCSSVVLCLWVVGLMKFFVLGLVVGFYGLVWVLICLVVVVMILKLVFDSVCLICLFLG